jgi:hypothetical protein
MRHIPITASAHLSTGTNGPLLTVIHDLYGSRLFLAFAGDCLGMDRVNAWAKTNGVTMRAGYRITTDQTA